MELSADDLCSVRLPFPSDADQHLIADYLDRETVHIDALVAEKEKMLTLLEEKRAALLSRAVTRGLDPDAPLKPSGLDWLGDIPAHWGIERAKNLFSIRGKRSETGEEELLTVSHITGVTPRSEKDVYMFQADDKAGYKLCYPGDVFDRYLRIWPVLIEQIDAVRPEALKRCVGNLPDAFRSAVRGLVRVPVPEAEFGGDDHAVADWFQRLANQLFIDERSVALCRIKEGHPPLNGSTNQIDSIFFVCGRTVAKA